MQTTSGAAVARRAVASASVSVMSEKEQSGEPITPEGLEALKAEISELEGPARQEMAKRIKAARELGDLKENAEYHIAKDDQAHLETRIKRLRAKMAGALVVEVDDDAETFAFGRSAEVLDHGSDKTHTWTLVGSTEADVGAGRISAESPVGKALMNSPVGADVEVETPGGTKTYRVEKLLD
jgi:transcription elongation factor GreA